MSEAFKAIIWLLIPLALMFLLGFVALFISLKNVSKLITPANLTNQQIVQFCEQLASQAVNEGWSYKKCISNLEKTGKNLKTLEIL